MSSVWFLTAAVAAASAATSTLGGCTTGPPAAGTGTLSADAWRPAPVAVRVYPSTRFVKEAGTPLLEARIELFDQMDDSIKASGEVECALFAAGPRGTAVGDELYAWHVTMSTLADQQEFFDLITRGYVYQLKLDDFELASTPCVLRIRFTTLSGDVLEAEAEVGSL